MENLLDEILEGEFIILRKTTIDDAKSIYEWRTGEAGKYMRQPDNYSVKAQENWILNRSENEINYIIFDKLSNEKVGTISIYDVNKVDKVTNVGRLLLSDAYLTKSNPYGLEAMLLTYNYVFNRMNFRKITGDIVASNSAMVKLQKYLGMKEEGYLSKHVLINGVYEDLYVLSLFAENFEKSYRKKINIFLKSFSH